MQSTVNQMLEHFISEDSEDSCEAHHKRVRHQVTVPLGTTNDEEFYETRSTGSTGNGRPPTNNRKRPVQRDTPARPQEFPRCFHGDLCVFKKRTLPKAMEKPVILPIVKSGKEQLNEVGKYSPISLINIGRKTLEKLLIDRINHNLYTKRLLNQTPYGFLPQKSTVGSAMAAKGFAHTHLLQRYVVIITSLDIQGAFDAACWPAILNKLRVLQCPRNLYNLTRSYFSDRVAIQCNNTQRKGKLQRVAPKVAVVVRTLERSIQHPLKPGILRPHKSNSLCG
jgi:hypothetical protein